MTYIFNVSDETNNNAYERIKEHFHAGKANEIKARTFFSLLSFR